MLAFSGTLYPHLQKQDPDEQSFKRGEAKAELLDAPVSLATI